MPTTIGTAYVQILPTTEGITSNLTGLLSGPSEAAGQSGGKSMGSGLLKGLGASAAAIGAGAAAAVGGIISMANQTALAGDVIDKQSQKLGVTAEQYQAMAYAAEHSGFSVETFGTAARKLAATDFTGNVWDAVAAIQAIEDPAKRAAKAEELLGTRAAKEMAPLINGTMTIDEYRASLEDLGGMMSNEAVAAGAAYKDAMTDVNAAISGVKNSLVTGFLPSMTDVLNGVAQLASGSTEGIGMIEAGFSSFLDGLTEKIPGILETGSELAMKLGEAIMDHIPKLMEIGGTLLIKLASGISGKLPELIPKAVSIISTIVNGLIQNIPALVQAALQLITGLATGFVKAIPTLVACVPEIISSVVQALRESKSELSGTGLQLIVSLASGILENLPEMITTGISLITSLITGLLESIPRLVAALPQIWNAIKTAFSQVDWAALGRQLIDKVKTALTGAGASLRSAATGVWNSVKTSFSNIDWKGLGNDLINGIITGLKNAAGTLYENVRGIIKKALGAGRDEAEVGSPSKLFARELGRWIPEGVAVGIEDNLTPVDRALRDVIGSAVQAMPDGGARTAAGSNINVYMTVSGAEDPETWAETFARSLKMQVRMGAI